MNTVRISVYDMNTFLTKWKRLNNKSLKLGLGEITYSVIGDILERDKRLDQLIIVGKELEICYSGIIEISGIWKLIAVLDHKEGLIKVLPDQALPEIYREESRSMVCDHCHIDRQRNQTFVLLELESGKYLQIGRNCLAEYLGIDPSSILDQYQLVSEIDPDNEEFTGSRIPSAIALEGYLSAVSGIVRKYGWLSTTRAKEEMRESTASLAWNLFFDALKDKKGKKIQIPLEEADKTLAKEAIEWAKSLADSNQPLSDYLFNLWKIANNGYTTLGSLGYAASMIIAFQKKEADRKEREKKFGVSQHIGEIGKKLTTTVRLIHTASFNTDYGIMVIYSFQDKDNNVIVWKTSKEPKELGIDPKDTEKSYWLSGTIKEHSLYKEVKQTVLTRAKVS